MVATVEWVIWENNLRLYFIGTIAYVVWLVHSKIKFGQGNGRYEFAFWLMSIFWLNLYRWFWPLDLYYFIWINIWLHIILELYWFYLLLMSHNLPLCSLANVSSINMNNGTVFWYFKAFETFVNTCLDISKRMFLGNIACNLIHVWIFFSAFHFLMFMIKTERSMGRNGKAIITMEVGLLNICPTKILKHKAPEECWSGKKPLVGHL